MKSIRVWKALLLGCVSLALMGRASEAQEAASDPPYEFTSDFVSRAIPVWSRILEPYKGKADLCYLEVGVFEGRSFLWMLDNVLTHPSSEAWAVDFFSGPYYDTFLGNLLKGKHTPKTIIRKGNSREVLRQLPSEYFDIIYIDGNHEAQYVMSDAVMAWELLKVGGLLIFDDYRLDFRLEEGFPEYNAPRMAVDAFVTAYVDHLSVVHDGYQKILRKRAYRCESEACTAFGRYSYGWFTKKLTRVSDGREVALSDEEKRILETFFRSRLPGETRFSPDAEFLASAPWRALAKRLAIRNLDEMIVSVEEVEAHRRREPDDTY